MPQLDYFSYWHQLVVAFNAYTYIFFLISFFFGPAIFLRPRILFLMQLYVLHYLQFTIFYVSKFFDLVFFNSDLTFSVFSSFISTGFGSLYLYHKQNKFSFFAVYFNSLSNSKVVWSEKVSHLTFVSSSSQTDLYSQSSFFSLF
jgi:hypothetical protein